MFASGPGTGTFVPGKIAALEKRKNSRALGNSSSLKNAGLRAMGNGPTYGSLADEQIGNPVRSPYRVAGRHDHNPNASINVGNSNLRQDYLKGYQSSLDNNFPPEMQVPKSR